MTMNGEALNGEVTLDYVHGRTIALESELKEIKRDTAGVPKLTAEVKNLTHAVRTLGQAVGLRAQTELPDDWEEITQVRRPELHELKHRATSAEQRARTRPIIASVGTALAAALIELIRAIADGRISFH